MQSLSTTQGRRKARLPVEMLSKTWPTWDPKLIRARILDAAFNRRHLDRKGAAAAAGMSYWNWMKKEGGDDFQPEQAIQFAKSIKAPTLFPFYDWDFALSLDKTLHWDE